MKKSILYTDPKMKEIAKILRKNSSLGEILLWKELRNKQLLGYEFQRQKPLGSYIVDFYCGALNLAIEIDGVSHGTDETYRYDGERDATLGKTDVHFLRFTDETVRTDMKSVLVEIEYWIKEHEKSGNTSAKETADK
jgi:very-short-patch-repair endonuclease